MAMPNDEYNMFRQFPGSGFARAIINIFLEWFLRIIVRTLNFCVMELRMRVQKLLSGNIAVELHGVYRQVCMAATAAK